MRLLYKSAAVAVIGLAVTVGTTAAASATAYEDALIWGGHTRAEVIFDNSGNETYYVRDAYADSYGAYATWWRGTRTGTCNDTNGAGTAFTACGPLNFAEGKAFETRVCSKDYNGSTLVDSKCGARYTLGTT